MRLIPPTMPSSPRGVAHSDRYLDAGQSLRDSPLSGGEGEDKAELDQKLLVWQLGLPKQEYKTNTLQRTAEIPRVSGSVFGSGPQGCLIWCSASICVLCFFLRPGRSPELYL